MLVEFAYCFSLVGIENEYSLVGMENEYSGVAPALTNTKSSFLPLTNKHPFYCLLKRICPEVEYPWVGVKSRKVVLHCEIDSSSYVLGS